MEQVGRDARDTEGGHLTTNKLRRGTAGRLIALAICLAAGMVGSLPGPAGAAPSRPLTVTLTFDDGVTDQLVAGRLLNKYGMSGTFYVSSGLIGLPGYMTRQDLDGLEADRHEIGGHTVTHANLPALPAAEVNRQICQDRETLLSWGHAVSSFAYPFSGLDASVRDIARRCGYRTARAVGSLQSPRSCDGCPVTESVPPADLYATRTPEDVDTSWSLADLRQAVTRAEASGGWLAFNLHHVCDSCSPASIRPVVLEQFLAWLEPRSSAGTDVRTVQQVIPGAAKPAVAAIPPRPPGGPGRNALRNPALEVADSADPTRPDCWSPAGFGTNEATYSRTADAHRGSFASRITMARRTDGDAKLVPTMDLGTCSPSVTADHTYEISAWYRSTTEVYFTLYHRDDIGRWEYSTQSPRLPAANGWTRATWITPAVPADVVAASFGLTIDGPGSLVVDDLGFADNTPAVAAPPSRPESLRTADPAGRTEAVNWRRGAGVLGIAVALIGLVVWLVRRHLRATV